MAYVIAEPCIGTKDTACVDVCPVDASILGRMNRAMRAKCSFISIRSSVSTAVPAFQCAP